RRDGRGVGVNRDLSLIAPCSRYLAGMGSIVRVKAAGAFSCAHGEICLSALVIDLLIGTEGARLPGSFRISRAPVSCRGLLILARHVRIVYLHVYRNRGIKIYVVHIEALELLFFVHARHSFGIARITLSISIGRTDLPGSKPTCVWPARFIAF